MRSTFPPYPLKDENLVLTLLLIRTLSFRINDPGGLVTWPFTSHKDHTSMFTIWTRNQVNIRRMDATNSQHCQHYKFPSMHVRNQSQYTLIINVRCSSLLQRYKSEMYKTKVQEICLSQNLCGTPRHILKTGQSWEKWDVWEPYSYVIC